MIVLLLQWSDKLIVVSKMQDIDSSSASSPQEAPSSSSQIRMSPYLEIKYQNSIMMESRTPSPNIMMDTEELDGTKYGSDDEISVGCPSPAIRIKRSRESTPIKQENCKCSSADSSEDANTEDYFKPLKRLKMVETLDKRLTSPSVVDVEMMEDRHDGVKSFSIADILNHKPTKPQCTRIVRPWDFEQAEVEAHHQRLETLQRHLKVQHLALLRPEFLTFNANFTSETGSDRSSSVDASDCCSPDIISTNSQQRHPHHHHHQQQQNNKQPGATPLDALLQMTSKTFDASSGETSADGQSHLNLFNSRQQPKKKRKSRTAFTNHQIFELEKRFLYQKYLSPADRDEIAQSLGLTNAQVITWFQNRRAKLKRDMEELKKDVERQSKEYMDELN